MNILNKIIITSLLIFSLNSNSQTYTSRKATLIEKAQIMYLKGHFNFLYAPKDQTKLVLKSDNTFTLNQNFCKKGSVTDSGRWKILSKELILEFVNSKTLKFKIFNKKVFYRIIDITRVADNKKMKNLTLLSL